MAKRKRQPLKHEGDKIINAQGVEFTEAEYKKLKSVVNTAMRKRRKMLQSESNLPVFFGGKDMHATRGQMQQMGDEGDFILAKKSKSLQRFRDKEEFNRYIQSIERVNQRDYIPRRVEQYRRNDLAAIASEIDGYTREELRGKTLAEIAALPGIGKDIRQRIADMSTDKYMKAASQDEALTIGYKYSRQAKKMQLEKIKSALDRAERGGKK